MREGLLSGDIINVYMEQVCFKAPVIRGTCIRYYARKSAAIIQRGNDDAYVWCGFNCKIRWCLPPNMFIIAKISNICKELVNVVHAGEKDFVIAAHIQRGINRR